MIAEKLTDGRWQATIEIRPGVLVTCDGAKKEDAVKAAQRIAEELK